MAQWWRSGESARLPPMCPGFNSRTRRHMWVEFVVGSRPSSEGFSPGSPVFLPPQKSTFLNSNSIGNSRATGLSVEDCYVLPSLNKVNLFIYLFIMSAIFFMKQALFFLIGVQISFQGRVQNEDFRRFNFHCSHQIFINVRYIYSSGHVADLVWFLT